MVRRTPSDQMRAVNAQSAGCRVIGTAIRMGSMAASGATSPPVTVLSSGDHLGLNAGLVGQQPVEDVQAVALGAGDQFMREHGVGVGHP